MKKHFSRKAAAKWRLALYTAAWAAMMTLLSLFVATPNRVAVIPGTLAGGAVMLTGAWLIFRQVRVKPIKLSSTTLGQDEQRVLAEMERGLTRNQVFGWIFDRSLGGRKLREWSGSLRGQDSYWWRELASAAGWVLICSFIFAVAADILALVALSNGYPA